MSWGSSSVSRPSPEPSSRPVSSATEGGGSESRTVEIRKGKFDFRPCVRGVRSTNSKQFSSNLFRKSCY